MEDNSIKLAILLITTHGNLSPTEDLTTYNEPMTVRKINATRPGVCNWISDDELIDMGDKMSSFINSIKEQWALSNELKPSNDIELSLKGTYKQQQQKLTDLSRTLRSFMPIIDGVHKDTLKDVKRVSKGKNPISEQFDEETLTDPDLLNYQKFMDETYSLTRWETNQEYLDKTYTILPDERIENAGNPYNNTIMLLGTNGLQEMQEILKIPYTTRSLKERDDIEVRLSEILTELNNQGYTDTIIIDLSCAAGYNDTSARLLIRKGVKAYGGKKRKNKTKRRKTKRRKTNGRKTKRRKTKGRKTNGKTKRERKSAK